MSKHDQDEVKRMVETAEIAAPVSVPVQPGSTTPPKMKRSKRPFVFGILALAVLSGSGYFGNEWWTTGRFMVSTDDAYLKADIGNVSARIQGYVREIAVHENQKVSQGDLLLSLDDGDYRITLETAQSKVLTLSDTVNRIEAQIHAAEAAVNVARAEKEAVTANLANATSTANRTQELATSKTVSQAQVDTAVAALKTAEANLAGADAQIASAEANVAVLQAELGETAGTRRELQLAVDQAQRDLDLTQLRAPYDGVITNLSVEEGDLVSPGLQLAAIVPTKGMYVEAYFKETQLAEIAPGAKATVTLDAMKGVTFDGVVSSTSPATGASFSLIPPDNATGNFTKIVQRVPVRISLPDTAMAPGDLRSGLSAVVEVDSRTKPDE